MDTIETTDTTETTENFGTDLAKSFALSAAASVGTIVGFVVVGAVLSKVQTVRKNRAAKKDQQDN